jgi:hypothetical protein
MAHGGVEIGATFLRPDVRASPVNPESKMLMLGHAFSSGAVRVQFKVDLRNARSQAAVAKLGAVKEGVLRRERCKTAKSTLEASLKEAGARLKSGLEDLKSIGKGDPAQIIIAFNVECLPR